MARLQWDPWRELAVLEGQVNDIFKRNGGVQGRSFAPALDAFHRENALWVRLELPGVRPEDVDISVVDGTLVVRGERKPEIEAQRDAVIRHERFSGHFERHVVLPDGTDPATIEASYDLGVLEIRIPHPRAKQPTKVAIKMTTGGETAATDAVEVAATEQEAKAESPSSAG